MLHVTTRLPVFMYPSSLHDTVIVAPLLTGNFVSVFIVIQSAGKPAHSEIVKFYAGFIAVLKLYL